MGYGDIPAALAERLASRRMRMYHALWHFVRNRPSWEGLPGAERQDLIDRGWEPPRFEDEAGAGIDFLFMHRRMIEMVNHWARETSGHAGHGSGAHGARDFVVGWLEIPWDHGDPVWPMPEVDIEAIEDPRLVEVFRRAKDPATTNAYRERVDDEFANREWLRGQSLDGFGAALEVTIHGWMHMHWSTEPPPEPNSLDPANDWLGSPFSSHVNKHFWKLHGWIDQRISAWADANGEDADLSDGWEGPADSVTGDMHSADPAFFDALGFAERPVLIMPWRDLLLEGG